MVCKDFAFSVGLFTSWEPTYRFGDCYRFLDAQARWAAVPKRQAVASTEVKGEAVAVMERIRLRRGLGEVALKFKPPPCATFRS